MSEILKVAYQVLAPVTLCVICFWCVKAGLVGLGLEKFKLKPGQKSGHYTRKMESALGDASPIGTPLCIDVKIVCVLQTITARDPKQKVAKQTRMLTNTHALFPRRRQNTMSCSVM